MRFGLHDTRGCSEFGLKNNGILYTVRSNHDISHRLGRLVREKPFLVLCSSAKTLLSYTSLQLYMKSKLKNINYLYNTIAFIKFLEI